MELRYVSAYRKIAFIGGTNPAGNGNMSTYVFTLCKRGVGDRTDFIQRGIRSSVDGQISRHFRIYRKEKEYLALLKWKI